MKKQNRPKRERMVRNQSLQDSWFNYLLNPVKWKVAGYTRRD